MLLRHAASSFFVLAALPAVAVESFPLPSTGCPMAHCDARMSDLTRATVPAAVSWSHVDEESPGAIAGLGCVSNGTAVACTTAGDPALTSNLVVYDADGNRIWEDGGILDDSAWTSAPIIGSDDTVIAADQHTVLRANFRTGQILWQTAKPDDGTPISPVLVGADRSMLLLATDAPAGGSAELSVYDVQTGALLAHRPLTDPSSGKVYVTQNTPAVAGGRAYISTAAAADSKDGRLYAVDVCGGANCGGRGTLTFKWFFAFAGPSGASPLLIGTRIFFDGRSLSQGTFMAVDDRGATARLVWKQRFAGRFVASAAQDERGGLWVYPLNGPSILRLNQKTGAVDQTITLSTVLAKSPGYTPGSVLTMGRAPSGAVVATLEAINLQDLAAPSYVAAIDVSSSPSGTLLWALSMSPEGGVNIQAGQFPIVTTKNGARRIAFTGAARNTYFIGEP